MARWILPLKKRFPAESSSQSQRSCAETVNWSSVTLARPRQGNFVMAEKKPQAFANHTRWDPVFHFLALPVFILLAVAGMVHFIRRPGLHSALMFVVAVALAIV